MAAHSGTVFSDDAAKRIAKAVKAREAAPQSGGIGARAGWPRHWNPGGIHAITRAGGIAAATAGPPWTPGKATVDFYRFDLDAEELAIAHAGFAYNSMTTAVAANTMVILSYIDGAWFVTVEECP